jgi:hypothetical protein
MIKQTDPTLPKAIQHFGCNFMSHLYLVRQDWSTDEVLALYEKAVKAKAITANCSVDKPQELLKLMETPIRQIGGIELANPKNNWGVLPPNPRVKKAIVKWTQKNSKHWHFTVWCVRDNGELYDPYCPDQATYSLEKCTKISEQYYG